MKSPKTMEFLQRYRNDMVYGMERMKMDQPSFGKAGLSMFLDYGGASEDGFRNMVLDVDQFCENNDYSMTCQKNQSCILLHKEVQSTTPTVENDPSPSTSNEDTTNHPDGSDSTASAPKSPTSKYPLNLYVHIPKTAGYAVSYHLKQLGNQTTLSHDESTSWVNSICNKGIKHYKNYPQWQEEERAQGIQCRIYISEAEYISQYQGEHNAIFFTMIRDPQEHILSQYFHCTEASVHRNKELMPNLTEWLQFYATEKPKLSPLNKPGKNPFGCYDPRHLQSRYLRFNGTESGLHELTSKFQVIGLTSHFQESVCLLYIHLKGGSEIPPECDCSKDHRLLPESDREDHGVTHHGSTFQLESEEQRALIQKLAGIDTMLYRYVRDTQFDEQVVRFEERYSFKLCR
jgi:hypothetical protein